MKPPACVQGCSKVGMALLFAVWTAMLLSGCGHDWEPATLDEGSPSISADGTQLVLDSINPPESFLILYDRRTRQAKRLTPKPIQAYHPIWSSRHQEIIFTRVEGHFHHLWSISHDGTQMRRITDGPVYDNALVISRDGTEVYFIRENWKGRLMAPIREVWRVTLGSDRPQPVLVGEGTSISSDGQRRAFASPADGRIFLFAGSSAKSNFLCAGYVPSVSPDGQHLAYIVIRTNWDKEVRVADLASGTNNLVYTTHAHISQPLFSLNGQELAFRQLIPEPKRPEIFIFSVAGKLEEHISIGKVGGVMGGVRP